MIDFELHPRIIENKDWATILFLLAFAIITINKTVFENRFGDFVKLAYSNKFTKIYRDTAELKSAFTTSMFIIQALAISFFILIFMQIFEGESKTDWLLFIRITTAVLFFIFAKILIEKIIAATFLIEEQLNHFNLQKVTYRTYIGLLLLPVDMFLYYNNDISKQLISVIALILLGLNVLTYFLLIKKYIDPIFSKLFYFILYLCALEIAPYYFMYYWYTK